MSTCSCQPGKGLCDSCLNTVYERNELTYKPIDNGNGEYTLNQIDEFEKKFKETIIEDVNRNNPLSQYVKRYPDFYDTVKEINNDFLKRPYVIELLPNYSVLYERLKQGPITALEWASFMKSSNYTPASAIESSNAKGSRFLRELDYYYNGDFSDSILGGFCGLFNSIYGAIDSFFNILGAIDAAIQDVFSFLQKIRNIKNEILAAFEAIKVKALIEAIKEKIKEMVTKAIQKVCQSIANFDVTAIIGNNVVNPTPAQIKVAEDAQEKKSALQNICGEDNIKAIGEKIQAIINYAVGLFSNPSIEEIIMLMTRLCGMAAGIEGLFKKLKDPLNDFNDRYDEVFNTISNASNRVTGEAIRAGAIRPTEENRLELINKARTLWNGVTEEAPQGTNANPIPPTLEEISSVPTWDQLKDNFHPDIKLKGGWVTRMTNPHEGWNSLDPAVKRNLVRLQKRAKEEGIISGHIYINSGYRNPEYNRDVGGARTSQHMKGNAVDLTWDSFDPTNVRAFIHAARLEGFSGFGMYNDFVHCDIGPSRSWDERSLTPSQMWAGTTNTNTTPANSGSGLTRNEARRKAMTEKTTVVFEEGGRTFVARYKPSSRPPEVGVDRYGDKIVTEYPGSVSITLEDLGN